MTESFWAVCKPRLIPEISDGDVEETLGILRPLAGVGGGRFREIITEGVDRRNVAFTWSPKLGRGVRVYLGGLDHVTTITFHTWAYYGFFKPSLAEACACIRESVPQWRWARFFWLNSRDMDARNIVGDYHWCPCILFGPERFDVIDSEWEAFAASCKEDA